MRKVVVWSGILFSLLAAQAAFAQGNAQAGKALWENLVMNRCSYCHGLHGEGAYGPDLAGRQLSLEQFKHAVRKPWGVMPTYIESVISDQDIANFYSYMTSLPRVAEPGPWRVPMPPNAPPAQRMLVETIGCAQCHGDVMLTPRAEAGAVGGDFEWFKKMVYEHSANLPAHRESISEEVGTIRMGNYQRARLPEFVLEEVWKYMRDDLKFRPFLLSSLNRGTSTGAYNLVLENKGLAGKGLAAEDITITLVLAPGTKVKSATGEGYQGVRPDPKTKADTVVWKVPRIGPKTEQDYGVILETGGITSGQVVWNKPAQKTGPDQLAITMPRPTQAP